MYLSIGNKAEKNLTFRENIKKKIRLDSSEVVRVQKCCCHSPKKTASYKQVPAHEFKGWQLDIVSMWRRSCWGFGETKIFHGSFLDNVKEMQGNDGFSKSCALHHCCLCPLWMWIIPTYSSRLPLIFRLVHGFCICVHLWPTLLCCWLYAVDKFVSTCIWIYFPFTKRRTKKRRKKNGTDTSETLHFYNRL